LQLGAPFDQASLNARLYQSSARGPYCCPLTTQGTKNA
jgi:hypothetical protein